MNKIFLSAILIIILLGCFLAFDPSSYLFAEEKLISPLPTNSPIQKSSYASTKPQPLTLSIPKLHVEGLIESATLDEKKRMDMPTDYNKLGWYINGPKPGEVGNAVIAGHFDKPGGPAIFYNLENLDKGDEIEVFDKKGQKQKFIVTDKKIYDAKDFPIDTVFGQSNEKNLNLITCDGIFDKNEKNYEKRLVVFTRLVE